MADASRHASTTSSAQVLAVAVGPAIAVRRDGFAPPMAWVGALPCWVRATLEATLSAGTARLEEVATGATTAGPCGL